MELEKKVQNPLLWDKKENSLKNPELRRSLKIIKVNDISRINPNYLLEILWIQKVPIYEKVKNNIVEKIKLLKNWDKVELQSNFDITYERNWVKELLISLNSKDNLIKNDLLSIWETVKDEKINLINSLSIENKLRYFIISNNQNEIKNLIEKSNWEESYSIFWEIRSFWLENIENYSLIRKVFAQKISEWYEINFYWNNILGKYLTANDIFWDQDVISYKNQEYTKKEDWNYKNKKWRRLSLRQWYVISFIKKDIENKSKGLEEEEIIPQSKIAENWAKKFDSLLLDNNTEKILNSLTQIFWIELEQVKSLIIRESWWDINAKSETWSRWIMQLTWSVFADMKFWGRWRWINYSKYFKDIPDDIINLIWDNYSKSKTAMHELKEMNSSTIDRKDYKKYNSLLNSAKKWIFDPALNIIMGCMYLGYQKELGQNYLDKIEEKWKELKIKKLKPNILHSLLEWKWISSSKAETEYYLKIAEGLLDKKNDELGSKTLEEYQELHPDFRSEYISCVRYNWDKTKMKDKIGHMYYFWMAVMITKLIRTDKKIKDEESSVDKLI